MRKIKSPYKTLSSKPLHKNNWFAIWKDRVIRPDGKKGDYFYMKSPPSVFIIALTEKEEVYLVKQYRYPIKQYSWELPAGSSEGMNPLKAAKKELWEETGLVAKNWKLLGKFQNLNGSSNETSFVYLAKGLKQTGENKQKEDFILGMKKVPLNKVLSLIKSGQIIDGQTIAAMMLFKK